MISVAEHRHEVLNFAEARARLLIIEDELGGYIPTGITEFSELHEHVDANMYLTTCDVEENFIGTLGKRESWGVCEYIEFTNEVIDKLNIWLKIRKHHKYYDNKDQQIRSSQR